MQYTFFITFVMIDGWASLPAEILRLVPLALYHLRCMFLVRTERDRRQAMDPGPVLYAQIIPKVIFYIMLGLVYSTISPLMTPFLLVFFAESYAVWRNQIINVYTPAFESKGKFWPHVYNRVIASLLIMQVTVIAIFVLKEAKVQVPFIVPLPFVTIVFHYYCRERFMPSFEKYALESATTKDTIDRVKRGTLDTQGLEHAYLHPALKSRDLKVEGMKLDDIPQAEQIDDMPKLVALKRDLSRQATNPRSSHRGPRRSSTILPLLENDHVGEAMASREESVECSSLRDHIAKKTETMSRDFVSPGASPRGGTPATVSRRASDGEREGRPGIGSHKATQERDAVQEVEKVRSRSGLSSFRWMIGGGGSSAPVDPGDIDLAEIRPTR